MARLRLCLAADCSQLGLKETQEAEPDYSALNKEIVILPP